MSTPEVNQQRWLEGHTFTRRSMILVGNMVISACIFSVAVAVDESEANGRHVDEIVHFFQAFQHNPPGMPPIDNRPVSEPTTSAQP